MVLLRVLILLFSWAAGLGGQYGNPLTKYIRHYEGLSYDVDSFHQKHQRAKRAVSHEDQFLRLDFHAHGRHFNLRMKRDTSLFSDEFKVETSNKVLDYDTSHIYTGHIYGEEGSFSHGSVIDGRFEGFIQTHGGTFYVEPAERYIKDRTLPFHSVIYHEDDINYPHKYGPQGGCADHSVFERMRKYQMTGVEEVTQINTTADEKDPTNPFRFPNIGVEKFLELNSEQNHDDYCLAYVFTDRDFDDGVLGLAWVGAPSGSSGGICEKSKLYSDGKKKSLNTGIITVQNYGSHVPPKVSHITFAHEVGHNFGSPHDSGTECTPGESKNLGQKENGNYIMYARATSGDKLNNNKFSLCSIRNISQVLEKKRNNCFVESGQPICGNGMVEQGEECDCGYSDQCKDECCYDANQPEGRKCKLKPGKQCSPSQGPCCTAQCAFKSKTEKCRDDSDCAKEGICNGITALCPASDPKPNFTDCNRHTQVCINGQCAGSICEKYGLEECTCASSDSKDDKELCHVCCMKKMDLSTCASTGSVQWSKHFMGRTITLQPGSPCNDFRGYCDVFMRCRLVDADGPLARLKKAIFSPELYENIAEWIVANWWAVLLMGIALIMLMAGFIKICSVHTPSSNPKLPPPKPLPGTLKRRRPPQPIQQPQRQRPRESYQMGHMRR
ncbi:disintegrin and metalloproteinase domain-containing protein 10 isoform X3 [Desmodus rotundus]|uniref:disintegrin and metalloproteinase domain-containing protein 10 isoform X3 n=1 Tax=Desmodus rotundus TaxID=9430 RepID=UPI0023815BCC|nr:disintegrin and metalloproteinase domain-containing protein 10 isoform X3 [Desmodus rotundus]